MDIVLGVSMTPTTVRMVLVEGERADGQTIDHDVFDVTAIDDAANSSAPDQVISAILGTQQSAVAGGHRLIATGVTWSDHDEAAALRDGLASRGIDGVTLVSDLHAAGALAQAAGRAVGYDKTALMFVERHTATLSVVETLDGSIVKVLSRSPHSADAIAVMTEMATTLEAHDARPQGVFVVGSGVDVTSVTEHLEHLVSVPVSAPEDAAMALARGAALAAAGAPRFEATTVGLAYSQDPDASSLAPTQLRPIDVPAPVDDDDPEVDDDDAEVAEVADESRRPFLLVGSSLTTVFVIGVVALVISLAVSIRPTVDQRPNPGESIVMPSTPAPTAPPVAQPIQPPVVQQPPPETIKPPVPVVQEAPQPAPRQVVVEALPAPPPAAVAPPPAAPPPAPEAPPPAPPPAQVVPPPVYVPPNLYPNYPVYIPPKKPWWYPSKPPWVDDDPPQQSPWTPPQQSPWTPPQQSPWTPPQQSPWTPPQQSPVPQQPVIPQQPVLTQQPLVPLVPVIQEPVFPNQPTLPPIPVIQEPVVPQQPVIPQPRQPVIQQPQQPSGPISRGRGNNPFWPF